ncbi:MAG: DUF2063 domain-containing protein [Hyphomonas sp.]|uniref:DNA-binding domain-containing protein n=1 Tax=Hyphomonas sp. TaxID=87 RepID=UPI0017B05A85|nr:DNA-binding domain-containing protein [Hyphomonas sp.]MBA3067576.1 DUF2063 domain-containing protein [Hyphomonas sp.]MBU3920712.1 DNA-binding domain-containing protein [Alphaproteobacteria bacterium]MBU4063465.1 DNA-binding domain-containing protein [Alphaproteobacteria bacterium]MBU4165286.1 DNA-binding domain-containing protein [Alphaproteobacteria bacterium]
MTPLEKHIALLSGLASRSAQPADLAGLMVARREPGQRALVYRNSGIAACTDALRSNYQRLARVTGDTFFRGLAHAYIDQHPPVEHSLVGYGHELPDFIDAAADRHGLSWLGDFARLDRGWLNAHLAADRALLAPTALDGLGDEALISARIMFHPSLTLVQTRWRLWDLWREAGDENFSESPRTLLQQEDAVLFWRPGHDVSARQLPAPQAAFIASLRGGEVLCAACTRVLSMAPGEDLPGLVASVLAAGFITDINTSTGDSQ